MTFAGIALPQMNLDINDASTFGELLNQRDPLTIFIDHCFIVYLLFKLGTTNNELVNQNHPRIKFIKRALHNSKE